MKKSIVIICKECSQKIRHMEKVLGRVKTRICPGCGTSNNVPVYQEG